MNLSGRLLLAVAALAMGLSAANPPPTPRARPVGWAQPVLGGNLKNLHQVSATLYRSSQPDKDDLTTLERLGVRSVLNLRDHHDDRKVKGLDRFELGSVEMEADDVTAAQLFQALRWIRDTPKPVLVHCWHGSDRTGVVIAAYRMVFERWTREAAVDEMVAGGFGYHARLYPNLLRLLESVDADQWRQNLGLPDQQP